MARLSGQILIAAALASAGIAAAQQAETAKPQVYALLAAIGNRFEVVHEVESVGSHLPPFRRDTFEIPDNILNRLVLQGLDKAVARMAPESRRIYLSTHPKPARGRWASEAAALEPILEDLKKLDRAQWHRILVATPAHRTQAKDGLPPRTQGMGLFGQPLCQSDTGFAGRMGSCENGFRPPSGPEALKPDGETIAANTYVAPFSFIEVWVLDAHTLEVLDRTTSYGHRKLADETASFRGILAPERKDFLAAQIVATVSASVAEALAATELGGSVDVKEKGPVKE